MKYIISLALFWATIQAMSIPNSLAADNAHFNLQNVVLSVEERAKKVFQVGTIEIAASPQTVFAVLTDYEHANSIFSHLKQCKVLTSTGLTKNISFESSIADFWKFTYILQITEKPPYLIEFRRESGAFRDYEGYWKLESLNDDKSTLVTYSKYVNAGILFPQFLVEKQLRADMPITLNELKNRVEFK